MAHQVCHYSLTSVQVNNNSCGGGTNKVVMRCYVSPGGLSLACIKAVHVAMLFHPFKRHIQKLQRQLLSGFPMHTHKQEATQAQTHTHTVTRIHRHTHTQAHTRIHMHTHSHTQSHAQSHTHTITFIYTINMKAISSYELFFSFRNGQGIFECSVIAIPTVMANSCLLHCAADD